MASTYLTGNVVILNLLIWNKISLFLDYLFSIVYLMLCEFLRDVFLLTKISYFAKKFISFQILFYKLKLHLFQASEF